MLQTQLLEHLKAAGFPPDTIDIVFCTHIHFDHKLTDEVDLLPTPGHTPGHCAVRIRSNGQEALITGDLIHHPLQAAESDVCSTFCFDEEQARATRRSFLGCCSDTDILVLGSHFSGPTGMHIRPSDGAWWVEASPYAATAGGER